MTRILCLWLANWPIQRIAQGGMPTARRGHEKAGRSMVTQSVGHGTPADRPLVLVTGGPRGAQVAVCSTAAIAQGVRVGMPLAEAQALAPQLVMLPHEPLRDREALAKLAEACERFSPCVGLEEAVEPESLLLDISNLDHLWGSEAALVGQVEKFFKRRDYHVRLGVAETIGLAWALAHFGDGVACSCEAQRSMSMAAPDMLTPSTMLTHGAHESIPPDEEPPAEPGAVDNFQFAAPSPHSPAPQLPIEALRISADTAALLRELGVETIDQLILLPREELTSRFGDELLRRLDQFTGAASEVVIPHRALPGLEVGRALDEPTADRAVLIHVLKELVEQLSRQLAARDQGAVLLMCLLHPVKRQPPALPGV